MKSPGPTGPVKPIGGGREGTGLTSNLASLLCYLVGPPLPCIPLTGIIFLIIERQDEDVRFHAWQSVIMSASYILLLISLKIIAAIMGYMAGVLYFLVDLFVWILIPVTFVLWVVCMVKAYQGERWRIPVIGDVAAKQLSK